MKTLFLDTNVLMQCRALEQLPWYEISKDEDISLLISRPVQEEIDLMKYDGNSRRAKRSRTATTLLRNILFSKISKVIIQDSGPHVEVAFAPLFVLKESPFPFLDLSRIDDRIIVEAIYYRDQHPQEDVVLLTHDTQPMVTSKQCGLTFIAVPDTWLLPPEPDNRDKRITELESKLQKLENNYPIINVAFKDMNDDDLHVACFNVLYYPSLSSQEIEELTKLIVQRNPLTTEFAQQAPRIKPPQNTVMDLLINTNVIHGRYEPPSGEVIRKYTEELYPQWIANVKDFFKSFPSKMGYPTREYRFRVFINNNGYVPAENVLVEFNLSDGIFLMPIDDEDKKPETRPLELPKPPIPPKGKWVDDFSYYKSLISNVRANIYPENKFDNILRDFSPYQHKKHDKNLFYWKPKRPVRQMITWAFECDEFRHKTEPEVFEIRIGIPDAVQPVKAIFECRVSARNLHDPVVDKLPVKVKYENQNSFTAAVNIL
jgi:hypothetical protein